MRETAEASIHSRYGNGSVDGSPRGSMYSDDMQQPILQHHPTKSSGLRYNLSEDNSTEQFNDGLLMHPRPRSDGRF